VIIKHLKMATYAIIPYVYGYYSHIKAAKTTFFLAVFSVAVNFLAGFTATVVKIRFGS